MTQTIHYHLPEGAKPSPLIQAFIEAADAAACLPPQCVPDEPDDDELDEDEDGYPRQDERDYDEFDFEPDYDEFEAWGDADITDRIMNGGDRY